MIDLPTWLLPLLGVLMGGGGLVSAIVAFRSENRKGPIERSAAQIADAVAVSAAARELVETVSNRLKIQDDRASLQDEQIKTLRVDLILATSKLDNILYTWNSWYLDLKEDWEQHRSKPVAPEPPTIQGI